MRWLLAALLALAAGVAAATTYNLPSQTGPFANCSLKSGTTYLCTGNVSVGNADTVNFAIDMTLEITGSFQLGNNSNIYGNNHAVTIQTHGDIQLGNSFVGSVNFSAGGNFSAGNTATITGNISAGGNISTGNSTNITGNVAATGNLDVGGGTITGTCTYSTTNYTCTPSTTLNHVELVHDGQALTCTPKAITVLGCTSSTSCAGVPGSQMAGTFQISLASISGASWCSNSTCSSTLTGPATVSSGTIIYLKDMNARTDTVSGTASSASNTALQCYKNGTFNGSTACQVDFAASRFLVSIPNHVSCSSQTMTVQAVRSSDNAAQCVPMFANTTRSEDIKFSYDDPASGTLQPTVGGTAIATTNVSVNLAFDSTGTATPAFIYTDVGKISVTVTDATITGMTGSATTIAAPAKFSFFEVAAGPIPAGNSFTAKVKAMNNCATPSATPNFGKEATPQGVTLGYVRCQPKGTAAVNGIFSGSVGTFSNGQATGTNLTWSEVGNIDLTATLTSGNYLSSGFTASGNTSASGTPCKDGGGNDTAGAVGAFVPHHFDTALVASACGFSYSGQPIAITITAMNGAATPARTQNYDGSANTSPNFAKAVSLADANALVVGSLSSNTVTVGTFGAGQASAAPIYAFSNPATDPKTIKLRASDADVTNAGVNEASREIRSGRLRLLNANGSELLDLPMTMRAEYWKDATSGWQINSDDVCTDATLNFAAVGAFNTGNTCVRDSGNPGGSGKGCTAAAAASKQYREAGVTSFAGDFNLWLQAPGAGNAGAMDVTATVPDWLKFKWTSAVATNPTARATFGVFKSGPVIYRRERY